MVQTSPSGDTCAFGAEDAPTPTRTNRAKIDQLVIDMVWSLWRAVLESDKTLKELGARVRHSPRWFEARFLDPLGMRLDDLSDIASSLGLLLDFEAVDRSGTRYGPAGRSSPPWFPRNRSVSSVAALEAVARQATSEPAAQTEGDISRADVPSTDQTP